MRITVLFAATLLLLSVLAGCESKVENKSICIVQTTDVHGLIFPYDFIYDKPLDYSLASVSTYVNEMRTNNPETVILLDNGDFFQGQPTVYYYNYDDTSDVNFGAEVYNFMKYDAITVGNHDIECGHPVYDKINKELDAPWLAANVINELTGEPYFTPYTIVERKGLKIAVLGLITPAIPNWLPENIWKGMRFEDMIESANKWIKIIEEKEQPDLVVGMFHAGINYEYNNQTADTYKNENATLLVAKNVPGFDIVLAGHDHKKYIERIVNVNGDTVVVVDPMSHARAVASIKVDFNYDKSAGVWNKKITPSVIEMKDYKADEKFLTHFEDEYKTIEKYVATEVGEFSKGMNSIDAYFGNSTFIDFIHEVQLDYSKAEVSFAAPLSFKNIIEKGSITVGDLFKLYKYENLLYTIKLSGSEIDGFLEFSYGLWLNTMKNSNDYLLQMQYDSTKARYSFTNQHYNFSSAAGIEYVVDVTRPVGQKVHILGFSDGSSFYKDSSYTVALNSYRGNGGGGHLTEGSGIAEENLSQRLISSSDHDLRFILKEYIKENSPIAPQKGTNWRIIPEDFYENRKVKDYNLLFE